LIFDLSLAAMAILEFLIVQFLIKRVVFSPAETPLSPVLVILELMSLTLDPEKSTPSFPMFRNVQFSIVPFE
jgi:hypothetical protein